MNTKLLGSWGEAKALEYLKTKGYKPVGMNYHTRFGEIDLIVSDKKYIVFVEVKMRKNADFARAMEFVDAGKIRRVRTSAELWLQENPSKLQPRLDVIEVYAPQGTDTQSPQINHIENAF